MKDYNLYNAIAQNLRITIIDRFKLLQLSCNNENNEERTDPVDKKLNLKVENVAQFF